MTTKKKKRRSDIKIMTKEAFVLKHLRESRKISLRKAAKLASLSEAKVNHAENGRCDLKPDLILQLLNSYGYEYEYFMSLVSNKIPLPENLFHECVEILKRLDKSKLRTIKQILESF